MFTQLAKCHHKWSQKLLKLMLLHEYHVQEDKINTLDIQVLIIYYNACSLVVSDDEVYWQ